MSIVKMINLTKSFKKQKVLDDITIEFESNKIHGIVGRNGSGKTVFLKLVCGLSKPTKGKIIVNEKEVGSEVEHPEDVGIIIESPGFIGNQTGYKNLEYLASLKKKISGKEIIETMEMVDLDPYSKKHVNKYSLGMVQRLGIAQAIMEKPDILLLDEPFNGLDQDSVISMRDILLDLKSEGSTIFIATHINEDVNKLCDSVYLVNEKKIRKI